MRVFAHLMTAIFFNFFVPDGFGGTVGDVVKIFYLLKETPGRRTQALLSVLVDRVIGLFSLIMLGGVILALQWTWLTEHPGTSPYVWPAVVILAATFFGIGISFLVS